MVFYISRRNQCYTRVMPRAKKHEKTEEVAWSIEDDPRFGFLGVLRRKFPESEWFLVGGAVRDGILGRKTKDYDLVVRHVEIEELLGALADLGRVDLVGKRFGVAKFRPFGVNDLGEIDIALPRTEKAGMSGGYRDFETQADPRMPIEKDLGRRDFTVNAMALDLLTGRLVDPYGGEQDLHAGIIRAVGEPSTRFQEDYSRMLRGIRFACELGFKIEERTWAAICDGAGHINDTLKGERVVPYETIAKELVKALIGDPGEAAELFGSCGLMTALIPETKAMAACEQSPDHHAEGDVWVHTELALAACRSKAFAAKFPGEKMSPEAIVATLLHDIGKPATSEKHPDGSITFYGHAEKGAALGRHIVERLRLESVGGAEISADKVEWLIKNHLLPHNIDLTTVKKTTLEKYFLSDPNLSRELLHLAFVDASSSLRQGHETDLSHLDGLIEELAKMRPGAGKTKIPALVSGEDVMRTAGLDPGPEVGDILEKIREAQLRGEVTTHEEAKNLIVRLQE